MKVSKLKKPPNKGLVTGLKQLVKKAESGEVQSFVAVSQTDKGELYQTICLANKANDYSILGCLQALVVRVAASAINNSEPCEEEGA